MIFQHVPNTHTTTVSQLERGQIEGLNDGCILMRHEMDTKMFSDVKGAVIGKSSEIWTALYG